jgi:N-methylhydantoinase A/oxoprolinase/acetone carboxylase beta subunit
LNSEKSHRVGIDIGGTFTDLVLIDDASGERAIGKVLTTPVTRRRPSRRAFAGCCNARASMRPG